MSRTPDDIAARARAEGRTGQTGRTRRVVDEVVLLTRDNAAPSIGEVLHGFGPAGALPMMMTVALIVVSPLSGIPFVSSLAGADHRRSRGPAGDGAAQRSGCRSGCGGAGSRASVSTPRSSGCGTSRDSSTPRPPATAARGCALLTAPPVSRLVLLLCAPVRNVDARPRTGTLHLVAAGAGGHLPRRLLCWSGTVSGRWLPPFRCWVGVRF